MEQAYEMRQFWTIDNTTTGPTVPPRGTPLQQTPTGGTYAPGGGAGPPPPQGKRLIITTTCMEKIPENRILLFFYKEYRKVLEKFTLINYFVYETGWIYENE